MAKKNPVQSAFDASKDVAQQAQDRLEALVRDVSRSTEEQATQMQAVVQELVDRSRDNTERISDRIAKQVQTQLAALGLATKADITRLERKIDRLQKAGPAKKSSAKKATKKKSSSKRA
jgi:polyhydroxyalkanoate synthesis regulator phasin